MMSVTMCFVIIFIVFIIFTRSLVTAIMAIVLNIFPVCFTLGLKGWLGLPLDVITIVNGTSDDVLKNAKLMQLFLPVLRTDFSKCETYVYFSEEPLDCPITAFGGLQDSEVSYEDLAAWRNQTYGSFALRMFPGNHFFLHSAQTVFLQTISQELVRLSELIFGNQSS